MPRLNERQLRVLDVLADDAHGWPGGGRLYAFQIEQRTGDKTRASWGPRRGDPRGTANTLRALARRGLVTHGGSTGCFVSATWAITDAGRDALREAAK